MADPSGVEAARGAFATARSALIDALYAFEAARDALKAAQRTGDATTVQAQYDTAKGNFDSARGAEATARNALQSALATWLPDATTPSAEVARLLTTDPIVLFPVRVETRFSATSLMVRIFPDEIQANLHETALTLEEQERARDYYTKLNDGAQSERSLWRDLIARFGVQRSAYILREMLPTFGVPNEGSSSSSSSPMTSIPVGTHDELTFPPDVDSRAGSWTRPGEAVLPDRWIVYVYKNGVRREPPTVSARIVEPLALTPDPKLRQEELVPFTDGYPIDPRVKWMLDFNEAKLVGMAVEVPLVGNDASTGFTRVLVVGVKSSISAFNASRHIERLLDAHHYTSGLALLRQGTATNNTEGRPTSYPLQENAGELSFPVERQNPPLDRKFAHDTLYFYAGGAQVAWMLGVPTGVFANVERSDDTELVRALKMNRVLWPATFGFFMKHLITTRPSGNVDVFSDATIAFARSYFQNYVVARGPAPALRVGSVPYSVLPIGALGAWKYKTATPDLSNEDGQAQFIETGLLNPLRNLLEVWKEATPNVPRLRPSSPNPDVDAAKVLATHASARQFRVRYGLGLPIQALIWQFFGWDVGELVTEMDQQGQDTLSLVGISGFTNLGRMQFSAPAQLFTGDVVAPTLSEDVGTAPAFVSGIATESISNLNQRLGAAAPPATPNLLYTVLRHSTLQEYFRVYQASLPATVPRIPLLEIFGLISTPASPAITPEFTAFPVNSNNETSEHRFALSELASTCSSAELERLFTETLDLTSHRLDPWVTAFAYRRLLTLRTAQRALHMAPQGDVLGGYGWVEDVKPALRQTDIVDGVVCDKQANSGGFIHAPSMSQASAAAVLRSGHLSVKGPNGSPAAGAHAVDLSSRRVRDGRRLFEGVRKGQPLGALLGYELERRLHDLGLDDVRFALRRVYPLVANKGGDDGTAPVEAIAARNVADGSLLLIDHKANTIPYGTSGLPARNSVPQQTLARELDRLAEVYDATADLLVAEGVYQMVRGNTDALVPTINNIVEGTQPPDTVISRSTRSGLGITHRVALVFPSDAGPTLPGAAAPAADRWPSTPTPRAAAEPVLNAWLGQIIGVPGNVQAKLEYFDADEQVIPSQGGAASVTIKLSDLGLHPLDVLALAEAIAQGGQGSILDLRIIAAGLADTTRRPSAAPASFKVTYDLPDVRRFPEIIEALNTAAAVLGSARPLALTDLLPPVELEAGTEEEETTAAGHAAELQARASAATNALGVAVGKLTDGIAGLLELRPTLVEAALVASGSAFPDPQLPDTALQDNARAVLQELQRRQTALTALGNPPSGATAKETTANAAARLAAIFGENFKALPALTPPRPDELGESLGARSTLLRGAEDAPDIYLQQVTRSRERLARFRKLNLYARTLGLPRPRVDVLQLPFVPGERWLGLPFDDPDAPPEEGRAALLLLNYAATLNHEVAWNGVVLDTWTETIPNRKEMTGVAFNYEGPRAKAPQAVLVAVPSGNGANWSLAELVASLEQTIDLSKIRAVDRELLGEGQLLPAALFATNENPNNVVSSTFDGLVQVTDSQGLP